MKFFLTLLLIYLTSCQSISLNESQLNPQESKEFEQAFQYVQNKEFKKAAEIYDKLIKNLSNETAEPLMLFNAGSVYRELGDCDTSVRRYRHLLEKSFNQLRFKSRGLLEISYSYECLGKTKLSFVSLKDLSLIRKNLTLPFNLSIYPARLGIAYARAGKLLRAEQYKSLALNGILQLKTRYSSEEKLNKELSSFFYMMGRSYVQKKYLEPRVFLRAFPHYHLYLWQALFIEDKEGASLAQKELISIYDKLKQSLKNQKNSRAERANVKQSFKDIELLLNKEKKSQLKKFFNKHKVKLH